MISSNENETYRVIPRGEFKCVWMTAGLLSYQLCEREYDCENCPLDAAMRMHFSPRSHSSPEDRPSPLPGKELSRTEYLYSRNHCWIRLSPRNAMSNFIARIGIEPGLLSVLLAPKEIVLPLIGEQLKNGQICLWIVMEGGAFPIASPLDGEVCAINARILEKPYVLFDSPFDRGWLCELYLAANETETGKLLASKKAAEYYCEDEKRFGNLLEAALKSKDASLGATLADGGKPLRDVSDMLGPKKYSSLVKKAFCEKP